jgi:hypothetical protein
LVALRFYKEAIMFSSLRIVSPQNPSSICLQPEAPDPQTQVDVIRLCVWTGLSLSLLFVLPTSFHIFVASLIAYFVGTAVCCASRPYEGGGAEVMALADGALERNDRGGRIAARHAA